MICWWIGLGDASLICNDLNLVIRQMRGKIDSKAPGLQLLRHKAMDVLRSWLIYELLHVKRDLNKNDIGSQMKLCIRRKAGSARQKNVGRK